MFGNTFDIDKRLNNFVKIRKIGEGTYGEVYEAIDTTNNQVKLNFFNKYTESSFKKVKNR